MTFFSHFCSLQTGELPLIPITSPEITKLLPLQAHHQRLPEITKSAGPKLGDWRDFLSPEVSHPLCNLELAKSETNLITPWPNLRLFADYLGVPTTSFLPPEPKRQWESSQPWGNPFRLEAIKTLAAHLYFAHAPDAVLINDPSGEWVWGFGQVRQWLDVIPFRLFVVTCPEQPQLAQSMEGQSSQIQNCPLPTSAITDLVQRSGGTCLIVEGSPELQIKAAKSTLQRAQFLDDEETLLIIKTWET